MVTANEVDGVITAPTHVRVTIHKHQVQHSTSDESSPFLHLSIFLVRSEEPVYL
jgi:hypothetical protein